MTTGPASVKAVEEWKHHLKDATEEIQDLWLDRYVCRTMSQIAEGCPAVNRAPFFLTWEPHRPACPGPAHQRGDLLTANGED